VLLTLLAATGGAPGQGLAEAGADEKGPSGPRFPLPRRGPRPHPPSRRPSGFTSIALGVIGQDALLPHGRPGPGKKAFNGPRS
jgi:hypothetical protein